MTSAARKSHSPDRGSRDLDEILAVVSHDLRSPLSALSVAIDALGDPSLDQATRERYLAAMRRAIHRADRFLNDLVDVSRMQSRTFEVDAQPVAVAELLEEAARQQEALVHDSGNWLVIEIGEGVGTVMADRTRVIQALDAMLANALRYARGSGAVTLRAEAMTGLRRNLVRLWVIDRGPGLPHGEVDRVFEQPWRRRDERRSGAGLGLMLARGIAEAHGGTIRAVSPPDGGAAFCLELPGAAR